MLRSSLVQVRRPTPTWTCQACLGPHRVGFTTTLSRLKSTQVKLSNRLRLAGFRGHKIALKHQAAVADWAAKAARIEAGKEQCVWDIFEERGYVKDFTGSRESMRNLMIKKRIGAYVGIDPTGPSLHLGHLLPLMPLFWMYMHGFSAITLLGSSTAKVGDPSGRTTDREAIAADTQTKNMFSMHYQLKKIWLNVEEQGKKYGYQSEWASNRGLVNNNIWWNKMSVVHFLHYMGSQVRVGPMLGRDTVKQKLAGDGLSFAELAYTLMQAWDWFELLKQREVQMQIGGSDQFGNIVTGVDAVKMARERYAANNAWKWSSELDELVGFTVPLLTNSAGEKIGKSTGGGNLWLDGIKTSPYDLYGYFVRIPDNDVERMLKLFTFMPMSDIKALMAEHELDMSKRVAQHKLAYEVLALVHGSDKAEYTQKEHMVLHGKSSQPISFTHDPREQMHLNMLENPHIQLPRSLIEEGKVARILFASGLAASVSDGQRLAVQQAVYIGGRSGQAHHTMDPTTLDFVAVKLWFPEDTKKFLINDKYLILRKGKHNIRFIEVISDEEYTASGQQYPGMPYTGRVRHMKKLLELRQELMESGADSGKTGPVLSELDQEVLDRIKPSDSKLKAHRRRLNWFKNNWDPLIHDKSQHPDAIQALIEKLEAQQALFELAHPKDGPGGDKGRG